MAEGRRVAALAALGIVFGDLGTSPLYTYQTLVSDVGGHPSAEDAVGLLSLVVWALLLTVSVKYCLLVMRADNRGEGGILALMSLVTSGRGGRMAGVLTAMGLFGAALIYGDGIITPAISVLSALEGINVATAAFKPYILPGAVAILLGLFAAQPLGTGAIGRLFGPLMLVWFVAIALLGLPAILRAPQVLWALDPVRGLGFLLRHGWQSAVVLGGVVLAITGGEALYADMGHFGRFPIRLAWYAIVLPALLLSYAGQSALLIANPQAEGNPFFLLSPGWALVPLVVIATIATVIASQAIITGAFSLTRQAMQLGWFPGVRIHQTSDTEYGQIYVGAINWLMMACTIALAVSFGSSERLSSAYGTAVSTTMLLTTVLLYSAMRRLWRWPVAVAAPVFAVLLVVDLALFGANLLKLADGGWIPLALAVVILAVMSTWHRGIGALRDSLRGETLEAEAFLAELGGSGVTRVPGTAVFLSRSLELIPAVLVRHIRQFKSLQETVVDLTVWFEEVPRVAAERRVEVIERGGGLWQVALRFGFVEVPNVSAALAEAAQHGCLVDLSDAVFVASRDIVVRHERGSRLVGWRRLVFRFLYRNAVRAPDVFDLPPERFVEITRQAAV